MVPHPASSSPGKRGGRVVYAPVDLVVEVLQEMTVQHRIALEKNAIRSEISAA